MLPKRFELLRRTLLTATTMATMLAFLSIISTECSGWKHTGKSVKSPCAANTNKLYAILNILCNNTQNSSITTRDACYGCFFRAGSLLTGPTQLAGLAQCGTLYLNNTVYSSCGTQLQNVVNGFRPTPTTTSANGCYQGYCEFVRCVRQTNANQLIDACFLANLVNRNLTISSQRIDLFTNLTSCVLSRTRCSNFNPITGELQSVLPQRLNARGAIYNALQITSAGDIRVVTFPVTVGVAEYFCSARATLEQDSFDGADC